jgi:hypothetical protein
LLAGALLFAGAAGCGFAGCFMFIFFLLVGKRFSSHVPIYAFSKKRKVIFKKNAKGLGNQALK